MATKKKAVAASTATAALAVPVGNDAMPTAANPHSWLHLVGSDVPTSEERFLFGVLRPTYRGWSNTAEEFGRRKLRPVEADDPHAVTAERAEVLLPAGADDRFLDPWVLLRSCDHERPERLTSLATYVTISQPSTRRLHEQWTCGHAWARGLVDRFGCPILLVQHAPHRAASANPPHLHLLLCGPRRLGELGWTTAVSDLAHDRGRTLLLASWREQVG